jgi:hypothetical protein
MPLSRKRPADDCGAVVGFSAESSRNGGRTTRNGGRRPEKVAGVTKASSAARAWSDAVGATTAANLGRRKRRRSAPGLSSAAQKKKSSMKWRPNAAARVAAFLAGGAWNSLPAPTPDDLTHAAAVLNLPTVAAHSPPTPEPFVAPVAATVLEAPAEEPDDAPATPEPFGWGDLEAMVVEALAASPSALLEAPGTGPAPSALRAAADAAQSAGGADGRPRAASQRGFGNCDCAVVARDAASGIAVGEAAVWFACLCEA